MKKILKVMLCLLMCMTFAGCSSSRSNDEVTEIIESSGFDIASFGACAGISLRNGEKYFIYNKKYDTCTYYEKRVSAGYLRTEDSKIVDLSNKVIKRDDASKLRHSYKTTMEYLDLDIDEIKTYLKNKYEEELKEYNKKNEYDKLKYSFEFHDSLIYSFEFHESFINDMNKTMLHDFSNYVEKHRNDTIFGFNKVFNDFILQYKKMPSVKKYYDKLKKEVESEGFVFGIRNICNDSSTGFKVCLEYYAWTERTTYKYRFILGENDLEKITFVHMGVTDETELDQLCTILFKITNPQIAENEVNDMIYKISYFDEEYPINGWIYSGEGYVTAEKQNK